MTEAPPTISIPSTPPRKNSNSNGINYEYTNYGGNKAGDYDMTVQDSSPLNAVRQRLNSKDIPRTYSGLYGQGGEKGDLLPFELTRNCNTEWLSKGGPFLLFTYIFIIMVVQLMSMTCVAYKYSWTVTSLIHTCIIVMYLHWVKGSPNFYEQGEMNAMTLWEQIDSDPNSDVLYSNHKRILFIIPTFLCHLACQSGGFDKMVCVINLVVWGACVLPKMRFMNGVRLLGINRTAGIDDYSRKGL